MTKESVLTASRAPTDVEHGAVVERASAGLSNAATNSFSISICDEPAAAAVRQLDGAGSPGSGSGRRARLGSGGGRRLAHDVSPVRGSRRHTRLPTETIGAPRGCSGVQRVPNAGQSGGFLRPLQDVARRCTRRTRGADDRSRRRSGARHRRRANASRRPKPLPRDHADAAPRPVADLEDLARAACCARAVPLAVDRRACTGSRPRCRPSSSAVTVIRMPWSRSSGSKPVTTIGNAVPRGDRLVLLVAHDRADVSRGEEALHPVVAATRGSPPSPAARARARTGSRSSRAPRRRRSTPPCALAGAVVSKPTAKKTTWRSGCFAARASRRRAASRRMRTSPPCALTLSRSPRGPGHAQHVAERGEDHLGPPRDGERPVDLLERA